eukprot:CAMPEP_0172584944 /NCGR_PEP_ID=MMETSP1068-20121228/4467_1 /TAXON_ID=35684 /ORGANISM="Pseudopedinella elastica, Strain CCMP716" /LENGTH=159 /DNA_ID=CAMNT_0013379261 /DNA_START=206 /DNA_END=685 /DNA_ORIENTATION=+
MALAAILAFNTFAAPPAFAISGGGLDYASSDISKKAFKGDYSKKDFSGCIANDAVFSDSTLRGARFFKSSLKGADFSGADLSSVSMEESDLSDVNFHGAVLEAAYFTGATLDLAKDIEDADFTDAIMRETMQRTLCARPDAKGTNPKTGIDTRDSLMCP